MLNYTSEWAPFPGMGVPRKFRNKNGLKKFPQGRRRRRRRRNDAEAPTRLRRPGDGAAENRSLEREVEEVRVRP